MAEKEEEWEAVPIEEQTHTEGLEEVSDLLEIVEEDEEGEVPAKALANDDEDDGENDKKKPEPRAQKRIDQLTAKHREEERKRIRAEEHSALLEKRMGEIETGLDKQNINQFKGKYDEVRAQLHQAHEDGDTTAQIDLTEQLTDMRNAAYMADKEREAFKRNPPAQPVPEAGGQEKPPAEAIKWWNRNRWFNNQEHMPESAFAREIDAQLEAEGFNREDTAYYDELDSRLQTTFPALYSNESSGTPRSKPKPPIAPSGSNRGSGTSKDGRMRFTQSQLSMATALGITSEEGLREYHKNLQSKGQS